LDATSEMLVTAGDFRLVGSPVHVAGYSPDYRPASVFDEYGQCSPVSAPGS